MHIALLTRQIGHYHDARYRGAYDAFEKVSVVQTASEGGFAEFLATRVGDYDRHALYQSRAEYDAALSAGQLPSDLSALLTNIQPDVLAIAGWANAESAAGLRWARANRVPTVMMSESQEDDASRSWVRERIKTQLVHLSDAAFVGGPPHRDYLCKLGMAKDKIALGYNAVDNAHFAAGAADARAKADDLRAEHGLPARYLLASARFIAKKNLPALVAAHAAVTAENPETPALVILGDGGERPKVEAARNAHPNPDAVSLLGFKGYDDLPTLYGLAEAFLHVSTVEQWGLVVNEAMSAGTPVIVSDKCGVARTAVRDGISGLITGTDPDDIAAALKRFLALSQDDRTKMGQHAAADIAAWGPSRFGAGLREAAEHAQKALKPRAQLSLLDKLVLNRIEKSAIDQVA